MNCCTHPRTRSRHTRGEKVPRRLGAETLNPLRGDFEKGAPLWMSDAERYLGERGSALLEACASLSRRSEGDDCEKPNRSLGVQRCTVATVGLPHALQGGVLFRQQRGVAHLPWGEGDAGGGGGSPKPCGPLAWVFYLNSKFHQQQHDRHSDF